MENKLFLATILKCGTLDLDFLLEQLDLYKETVFENDEEFSYQQVLTEAGSVDFYGLLDSINNLAINSALKQVGSDELSKVLWNNVSLEYNFLDSHIYFNEDALSDVKGWKEFKEIFPVDDVA